MAEKMRVDISGYVDINITPELKELLDKYFDTNDNEIEVYYEIGKKIRECIDKELYKKGLQGIKITEWDTIQVLE